MIKNYLDALKRMSIQLTPISEYYNCSKYSLWFDALWAHITYGVTPNQYIGYQFYKKSRLERKTFYTYRHAKKYEKILNSPKYYDFFWNKAKFNMLFKDFIKRDWVLCEKGKESEIQSFINSHDKIIVKPTNASSGKGIHIYQNESISSLINAQALLEDFVIQHHSISKLNSSSVNTIRVYTILDKSGKPHILTASLRVGGKGSEVDNYHAGGVGYPIDIKTGVIMGAGADIMGKRYIYHPGSQTKVVGYKIPNYQGLVQFVFNAIKVCPQSRLIAWDIAVLEDGFELIEGNYDGDPGFMQTPSGEGQLKIIKSYI